MHPVSIIVPVYNAEPFLDACLRSLTHQTYRELEIVLVLDGPTDNSRQIALSWAKDDDRIVVIEQTNHGQAAARNHGLKYIKGSYVMFVDADDYLEPQYVQHLLESMLQREVDVVQAGYRRISIEGEVLETKLPKHPYQFTSACMRLYRREVLQWSIWQKWSSDSECIQLFPEGIYYEDVVFSTRLWQAKPSFCIIDETGYCYRCNPHSTTSRYHSDDYHKALRLLEIMAIQGPRRWVALWTMLRLSLFFMKK